jgi:hypothetical protein
MEWYEAPDSLAADRSSGPQGGIAMGRSLIGALLGAALVIALSAGRGLTEPAPDTQGGPLASANEGGGLIANVTAFDGKPLTLTVVDPRQRWIGVYHVDPATGAIALKSARNITWDAQLTEWNSEKPLPQEIRSGLPR